ncbi:MAG: hypothetical protein AAGB48_06265 [Planctomycetota bacterium]
MTAPLSHFVLVPIWSWKSFKRRLTETIETHGAPRETNGLIIDVVTRTRLWPREQMDVARELACHFRDAEAAGQSPNEAVEAFGPPRLAAKLIRRAKRRQRGPVWKTWYASTRGLGIVTALAIIALAWHTSRVFLVQPTVAIDALAELNAAQPRIHAGARGYAPLLEAIASFRHPPAELIRSYGFEPGDRPENIRVHGEPVRWIDLEPGHPAWPLAAAHAATLTDTLDALGRVASSQGIGYVYRLGFDPAYVAAKVAAGGDPSQFQDPLPRSEWHNLIEGSVLSALLPHLSDVRELSLLLTLAADAESQAGRPDMAAQRLADAAAIGGHMLDSGTVIEQLVGLAIIRRSVDRCHRLLDASAERMDGETLMMLAHRFGGIGQAPGVRWRFDLTGERIAGVDTIQRAFSDDGDGGGHLTNEGIAFLHAIGSMNAESAVIDMHKAARLGRIVLFADRRSAQRFLERGYVLFDRANGRPLAELRDGDAASALHIFLEEAQNDPDGLLAGLMVPSLESAFERAVVVGGHRDALLVRLAAILFERANGWYPQQIDELAPRWLPRLPLDPWIDAPMRLRSDGATLTFYSVGGDLDDDGGTPPSVSSDAQQHVMCEHDRWPADGQGSPVDGDAVLWSGQIDGKPRSD